MKKLVTNCGANLIVSMLIILFSAFNGLQAESAEKGKDIHNVNKTNGNPQVYKININRISTWIYGDGMSDIRGGFSGFEFPKGSNKKTFYQSGFIYGGKVNGEIRAGGTTYRTGLINGIIKADGAAEDPLAPTTRMYRVRKDVPPTAGVIDFSSEINDGEGTAADIKTQYLKDWQEWPAEKGAPYTDVNKNGKYDPAIDVPGFPGADQTIWYPTNDLNDDQAKWIYGSKGFGFEIQTTIWAYNATGPLGNMIFRSYKIINKGQNDIKDFYACMWSDPDNGDPSDDLAGCDTVLNLGYCYNGKANDASYGTTPPAAGFDFFQGPVVATGNSSDSAIVDIAGKRKKGGFKNLGMSSFFYFINSDPVYTDPEMGNYNKGALQFYNLLQGLIGTTGQPFTDPTRGGASTKFPLYGDPVSGNGFVDGLDFLAGDRRIGMVSGPFNMAKGDTQEVVVAQIAAGGDNGIDRLSAVSLLKDYARVASELYKNMFRVILPVFEARVAYTAPLKAIVKISATDSHKDFSGISVDLMAGKDDKKIASAILFDDGQHGDGQAGDGVFANFVEIDRQTDAIYVNASITSNDLSVNSLKGVLSNIVTRGDVKIIETEIFSDNLNEDGVANPSENIRFGLFLNNYSPFNLSDLRIVAGANEVNVPGFSANSSFKMTYNSSSAKSYFSIDIPGGFAGKLPVYFKLFDKNGNNWIDTVYINVIPPTAKIDTNNITHRWGNTDGNFQILMVDPSKITTHEYSIRIVNLPSNSDSLGFTLHDNTLGKDLLVNHDLPDEYGHNIPVIDGFKILKGSIDATKYGMRDYTITSGSRKLTWTNANIGFEGFSGAIGYGGGWFPTTVAKDKCVNTLIKFAKTDVDGNIAADATAGNVSKAYRYLRSAQSPAAKPEFASFIIDKSGSFAYQDMRDVPFAAFDTEHGNRRLAVGFSENNVAGGLVDGKYWPGDVAADNVGAGGPREWFYIFDADYSETPSTTMTQNILSSALPVMWHGTPNRRGSVAFANEDEFLISTYHALSTEDVWLFMPYKTVSVKENALPAEFALEQNYPNPFNPSTTIKYALPSECRVKITVFNILGQVVSVLQNEQMHAGYHSIKWDAARNSSGVYFCAIETTPLGSGNSFKSVKKMLLMK